MESLRELKKMAEESKDLKKQLAQDVGRLCNLIADLCDEGMEVNLGRYSFWIEKVHSWDGDEKFLFLYTDVPRAVTDSAPGSAFYLYGDYSAKIHVAELNVFIWVAEHAQQLVNAFVEKMGGENERIRRALKVFKESIRDLDD